MTTSEHDNDELLRRIQQGDEEALGILFDRFGQAVYNLVYRIVQSIDDAEAVAQDVFLNAWRKSLSYDGKKTNVEAWLMEMAKEHAAARRKSRLQSSDPEKRMDAPSLAGGNAPGETLPDVVLSSEVRENILFTVHVARIAESEAREQRKREEQTDEEPGRKESKTGVPVPPRKNHWLGIGMTFTAIVMASAFAVFIHSLLKTIDRQKDIIADQENRIVQLSVDLDDKDEALSILQSRKIHIIPLKGLLPNAKAHGKVLWDAERKIALVQASDLPKAPPGKTYVLWFMKDTIPVHASFFEVPDSGKPYFKAEPIDTFAISDLSSFEISVEPSNGSAQPTGEVVLSGKIFKE